MGKQHVENNRQEKKGRKKGRRVLLIILVIIAALVVASAVYVNQYYHASEDSYAALEETDGSYTVTEKKDKEIVFAPSNPVAGLIFYPGGKVEYEAYVTLMEACAERGIFCVLVHEPANLAILDKNAANDVIEEFPDIEHWYVGGHSLGGVMAASYASKHADQLDGLVMLAAYSTADLSDTDLKVLSMYGSKDGVLNRDNYEKNRDNLPEDTTEQIIDGGCHSYFGSYGMQKGDGNPTITRVQQIEETADAIYKLVTE